MALWIPGPYGGGATEEQWEAYRRRVNGEPEPESPHQAAIAEPKRRGRTVEGSTNG